MATAPQTYSSPNVSLQASAARQTAWLLWWAAGMLALFLAWLWKKHEGDAQLWLTLGGVVALAAVALAVWNTLTGFRRDPRADHDADSLQAQARSTRLAVLVGSLVLLGLAAWIGLRVGGDGPSMVRWGNFGEASSLALFALLGVAWGFSLGTSATAETPSSSAIPTLLGLPLGMASVVFLALGLGLAVTFLVLTFGMRVGQDYFPELLFLFFTGLLLLASGAFLFLNNNQTLDPFQLRVFTLILGGIFGFLVFVYSLGRSYAWSNSLFASTASWSGENGYRVWICVYTQLIGLGLMFASLLLAKADIRNSTTLRRTLFGYTMALEGLLLVEILLIVNIVVYVLYPYNFDWSAERGLHTLSPSTKNLVAGLKEPTTFVMLMSSSQPMYNETRDVLENMQAVSSKVNLLQVSPDSNRDDYGKYVNLFPQITSAKSVDIRSEFFAGRGVLVVYGAMPQDPKHRVPYAFIPADKLFEQQGMERGAKDAKPKILFKGESEIQRELSFLVGGQQKRRLYFLQGHEELDIANMENRRDRLLVKYDVAQMGAGRLVERLRSDNFEVKGLSFAIVETGDKKDDIVVAPTNSEKRREIPADAYALVIAGSFSPLEPEAIEAIERYLERGGRLLATFDLFTDADGKGLRTTGLEATLKKFNVEIGNEFLLRFLPLNVRGEDRSDIIVASHPENKTKLAMEFANRPMIFHTARVVKPGANPGKFKAQTLFAAIPNYRGNFMYPETNVDAVRDGSAPWKFQSDTIENETSKLEFLDRLKKVPKDGIPMAVTVSEEDKPRMVILGDTEFLTNGSMTGGGRDENYAIFFSALNWMSDRGDADVIGPKPKETGVYALKRDVDAWPMIFMPAILMAVLILGTGLSIWIIRRR